MATATKKSPSKVVSGNTKKISKRSGVNPRVVLFAVVGVLAFSVAAGLGWQQWQDHQLDAKAAGWTTLPIWKTATAKACRIRTSKDVYTVKVYVSKGTTAEFYYTAADVNGGNQLSRSTVSTFTFYNKSPGSSVGAFVLRSNNSVIIRSNRLTVNNLATC